MDVRTDFHIHTSHVGCADETMTVPALVKACEDLGCDEIAITDHLNTLDSLQLHHRIKEDILKLDSSMTIYFGAELNFDKEHGDFAITDEAQEELGFQFLIAGIHSAYGTDRSPEDILRTQHEHHLLTCSDPRVSVLVHPYWFGRGEFKQMPWLTDLSRLKEEWIIELGQTAARTNTAIEINGGAIFASRHFPDSFKVSYKGFLNTLKELGVMFSVSSDAHNINRLSTMLQAEEVVEELGIPDHQIWHPSMPDIREVKP